MFGLGETKCVCGKTVIPWTSMLNVIVGLSMYTWLKCYSLEMLSDRVNVIVYYGCISIRHGVNSILSIPIPIPIPPNSIWSIPIPIPHQIYQFQFKIDQFQFNYVYIFFYNLCKIFLIHFIILIFSDIPVYVQCNLPNQDSQVSALNCPDQTSVLIRQSS